MKREEFMNLKTGETFIMGYRKFIVLEDGDFGCEGCYFDKDYQSYGDCEELLFAEAIPRCSKEARKDRKNVVFVEVREWKITFQRF